MAADRQLANEIEFDLRKFEEQQAEQERREAERKQQAQMGQSSPRRVRGIFLQMWWVFWRHFLLLFVVDLLKNEDQVE